MSLFQAVLPPAYIQWFQLCIRHPSRQNDSLKLSWVRQTQIGQLHLLTGIFLWFFPVMFRYFCLHRHHGVLIPKVPQRLSGSINDCSCAQVWYHGDFSPSKTTRSYLGEMNQAGNFSVPVVILNMSTLGTPPPHPYQGISLHWTKYYISKHSNMSASISGLVLVLEFRKLFMLEPRSSDANFQNWKYLPNQF